MSGADGAGVEIVPDLLRARAAASRGTAALAVEDARRLTYGDWDDRSNHAARGLAGRGAQPRQAVALVFDNSCWDDYAVAYLAAHKAGVVAVPLDPSLAGPHLAAVLAHCEAVGVIAPAELALPPAGGVRWLASLAELEAGQAGDPFQVPLAGGDLAEIVYTSGTTGRPKGVACSHSSIVVHDGPPEQEGPVLTLLHAFPVGTNANQEVMRVTLRRSDRLAVAMAGFDPVRLCDLVESHRVARLQLVPSMAQLLMASGAWMGRDLTSVEVVVLSSAPLRPALVDRLARAFPRARVANAYALTESGTARTLNPDARAHPGSVGLPVGRSQVRIVDVSGDAMAVGGPGEVLLRRPGAPRRHYLKDPDATAAAFVDGWLRTGDVGWLDGEGALHLVDRSKDVIICGGLNVSSVEVENVLYEHPGVVEAAVVGVPHEVLGQDVAAAVVVAAPVSPRDLQALARRRLAEHQVPHRIAFVESLPRTESGKVRKRELLGLFEGGPAEAGGDPPATPEEQAVAAIWEEVLDVAGIGARDDFFALGGHSLAATRVLGRIGEDLGVDLPVTTVFEHPTVSELAAEVAAATRG
ncbi:MAG: AMP-binding protein, partial [Acidimicrobiales bacterium]